jgi:predicted Na+-dependent transporter
MSINAFLSTIVALSGLLFVVSSMLAMGLDLTTAQIVQPLKNVRLVVLALLGNFVLVPLLAYAITRLLPLSQDLQIGLIVLSTVAGAPLLIKEVEAAKGDLALGVGMMFLLMVVTIAYVPLALPVLLPGVEINPWDIAKSLIVTMLIPMVLGLMYHTHSEDEAKHWAATFNKVSSITLLIMLVIGLGLNISNIISLIGSMGFVALILFVFGSLAIGFITGGRNPGVRSVMGLATAQRNVAAAILVTSLNFSGTMTLPFILVASILLALILIPVARRLGKSSQTEPAAQSEPIS